MPEFRIATEGATTDGRKISAEWLTQMAANYDPEKYGCRLNLEHIRGVLADSPFKSYGDVNSLKTEKNSEGKLVLIADIDPTDELVAMNKARQKVYTSMEVDLDFADTGEAYLVGLAVTDSPASLGTQMLQFSSTLKPENSPLTSKKQRPENLFSEAAEVDFTQGEADENDGFKNKGPSLAERVRTMFKRQREQTGNDFTALRDDLEQTMALFVAENANLRTELEKRPCAAQFNELKTQHHQLKAAHDELYAQLDKTPRHQSRTPATGSDGSIETDC
ncbi:GPO family capsid scaffolding protein [Larsenimonas rhizosphaerae]|uniref:GPO family capsid scaffolding protein n=1 Tax=Larsenimonas rhizosphaerae TaxID=2944682 RepID=UPI002034399B|nr:GPO family capsid scaffolding protein [Larsenimonas rhizosphaerae]MCM2131477.1 GPO family capsid scaffolding protein [Larsenimonas rhizosphaerae]